ncbi:MAG: FliG C-terminal domain-containing protein [Sandaracinaceae bacterium]
MAESPAEGSLAALTAPEALHPTHFDRKAIAGLRGSEKALLFLVSLDERVATRVLANLDDEEVRRLRTSSHGMEEAPPRAVRAVLHEFLLRVRSGMPASLKGSHAYLRRLVGNALGEGRAAELWSDEAAGEAAMALARLEVGVLEALLEPEPAQTVAVVLSQLPAGKASEIVQRMDGARRQDVITRLALLESVPEAVLGEIERSFEAHASQLADVRRTDIAGKQAAAAIVKRLPEELGQEILEALRSTHAGAADEIEKALFTFEDLLRIDSRGMQQLLKEVATDQLVVALKTASDELKEKVFGNVSSRAADLLHEELELLGPVRLSDVEEAQQAIIQTVLTLEREGRIMVAREGGGDYV